ncbi:MAG: hypothetical protein DRQ24_05420 [Candidatus Latescibacterota bacterium]|nr:MAG: hypothetical protein DRQ24_05420 [Candidatus Latescibacterota bacterium]
MSRIIKSVKMPSDSVPVGTAKQELTQSQSSIILHQAEQIVKVRLKEFEARCEAEKEQAYAKGFEEGKTLGIKLSEEKVAEAIGNFSSIIQSIELQQKKLFRQTEKLVIQLALAVAEKIIDSEVTVNKEIILNVVRKAIEHLVDKTNLLIKVNPEDLKLVREHRQDWLVLAGGSGNLIVNADPSLRRGDCVIETDSGQVNARIEKQLDVLKQTIVENVPSE